MAGESALGGASSFIGNTIGEAAAFAAGLAIGPVLRPLLQALENETWSLYPDKPLDPQTMAIAVAQGRIGADIGAKEAALSGIGPTAFANLVNFAQSFPDSAMLIDLARRKQLPDADLVPALQRGGLTVEYAGYVADLVQARLTPQEVALGIVRGTIPDPGILPVTLDTTGTIKGYPQFTEATALEEAADGGFDLARLTTIVGSIGLPMSLQQAASATFRSIVQRGDFNRAVLEGDTRPEWADAIFEQARQILSAEQYTELEIRGFYDRATRLLNTEKHGMSDVDSDNLYNVLGRAPSTHQVVQGLARGGKYPGSYANVPEPYKSAIQRSNIREEWSEIVYAGRYTYPAPFILKALATAGDIPQAEVENILLYEGWEPTLAATVSAKWAGGTGAAQTVKKETLAQLMQQYLAGVLTRTVLVTNLTTLGYTAQQADQLITAAEFKATSAVRTKNTKLVEKQYVAVKTSEATARQQLAELGWPANVIDNYIAAWNIERDIAVTTLTVAQLAAALKAGAILASVATPLLADLGENAAAIQTIIATSGADPNT